MFFKLALKSLLNRRGSVAMSLLAVSVAVFVLAGVEHIRHQAKHSFASTISGTDLIVGAKTGKLNLLLYSVFRVGSPTDSIRWDTFQNIRSRPDVAWAIPISLGDSHRGYPVVGTTDGYFQHFSYGKQHKLAFAAGTAFAQTDDVVLGADVARSLDYGLDQQIILAHGLADTHFNRHDDTPFTVVGILAPTGTPVDQSIYVSLAGIEAMHAEPGHGVSDDAHKHSHEDEHGHDHHPGAAASEVGLAPRHITAFMLGLQAKALTFTVQRQINDYAPEPLLAILPGLALAELWQLMGVFETMLRLISALILLAALLGLGAVLLASVRERRHEIRLLRVLGAPPFYLFLLMELEALLISIGGICLGILALAGTAAMTQEIVAAKLGLHIEAGVVSLQTLAIVGPVVVAGLLIAAIPALQLYSQAKADDDT